MSNYPGIDYGMGKTNIDRKTGIRYGVISQNDVLQAWADSSEPDYPIPDIECSRCQTSVSAADGEETLCPQCGHRLAREYERAMDLMEPAAYVYMAEGYRCFSDSVGDIFIELSPYFTYAQFCSPCAPGACHLGHPLEEPASNNKCYCFGHDWFDGGKAPYPVYSVETGELVEPE